MYPAYKNMQLTLINRRATDFQCGDVIVFYSAAFKCTMVKRIIAVSGDTVLISDRCVLVNNTPSPYTYTDITYAGTAAQTLVVSDNSYFVMGDNHSQSKDSRYDEIGCVSREEIIGLLIPNRPLIVQKGLSD
jgi:signal peptidase I, bacterial type